MAASALLGAVIAMAIALPLSWKWQLGARRSLLGLAVLAAIAALAVAILDTRAALPGALSTALVAALTLVLAAAVVAWRFYRDPERLSPDRPDVVVSPADGVVTYVHRSQRGELPVSTKQGRRFVLEELVRTPLTWSDAIVVGIALSFLDVHVNRAPIAGTVRAQKRARGGFTSLKDPVAVYTNERVTAVIKSPRIEAAVVLIASRLVRRIVSFVREGEDVVVGQRIGVIRFGSQVDLVLPDLEGLSVLVRPGERVRAGETVVALLADPDDPGITGQEERRRTTRLPSR
jgi:phosphatidylserine decarboxylase